MRGLAAAPTLAPTWSTESAARARDVVSIHWKYSITRAHEAMHYGGRREASSRPEHAQSRRCQQQRRCALLTMAPRTEQQRRRRAENERRRYTAKRLALLKERFPEVPPPDVLQRAPLRQVSVAVRRIGDGQSALGAFRDAESSSGSVSNIHS